MGISSSIARRKKRNKKSKTKKKSFNEQIREARKIKKGAGEKRKSAPKISEKSKDLGQVVQDVAVEMAKIDLKNKESRGKFFEQLNKMELPTEAVERINMHLLARSYLISESTREFEKLVGKEGIEKFNELKKNNAEELEQTFNFHKQLNEKLNQMRK